MQISTCKLSLRTSDVIAAVDELKSRLGSGAHAAIDKWLFDFLQTQTEPVNLEATLRRPEDH